MRVVVIGGGPAGATAARVLAQGGVETVLLERDLHRAKPCGGGIPWVTFQEFRLDPSVVERRVDRLEIVAPSGLRVAIPLGENALAMVQRQVFDASLRRLASQAGAAVIQGHAFAFRWKDKGVEVRYRQGRRIQRLEADWMIGADGATSQVARALGLGIAAVVVAVQEWVAWEPREEDPLGRTCQFWYGSELSPDFYAWVFPKGNALTLGTGGRRSTAGRLDRCLEVLKARLESGRLGKRLRREAFPIPTRWREPWAAHRTLRVGDAAGFVMPTSGEGIYYAMKSGAMAAEAILSGGDPARTYARAWRRTYRRRYQVMARLQELFYRDDAWRERLVRIHRRPDVQAVSMDLWLKKDLSARALLRYVGVLRRALGEGGLETEPRGSSPSRETPHAMGGRP